MMKLLKAFFMKKSLQLTKNNTSDEYIIEKILRTNKGIKYMSNGEDIQIISIQLD